MRPPRFRIRTLMIAVAATAILCEAYVGLGDVLRWYFFYHRAQLWSQDLERVQSWTGTRRAQPGYASLLSECQQAAASYARWEREHRPLSFRVVCLVVVVLSPFVAAVYAARHYRKRRLEASAALIATPVPPEPGA